MDSVSDDVVLAIQRTIAAIGSDPAAIEALPPSPRLPDRVTDAAAGISISTDDGLDRGAFAAASRPTNDVRRSSG